MKIAIETTVNAAIEEVWRAWTSPEDIIQWNSASDEWHTTSATIDLSAGGGFAYRMEAKDGRMGFVFAGTFTQVVRHELIEFTLDDNRVVVVEFTDMEYGVRVYETFDLDPKVGADLQRAGWQAILNRFARHVESAKSPTKLV